MTPETETKQSSPTAKAYTEQTEPDSESQHRIQDLEEALRQSETRYLTLVNALPTIVSRINKEGDFLDISADVQFPAISQKQQFVGNNIFLLLPHDLACLIVTRVERALQTGELQVFEFPLELDGKTWYREARIAAYSDSEAIFIVHDITDQNNLRDQLHYLHKYDALTGLYNRAYFEESLQKQKEGIPLGVIVGDIDGLKLINDTLGSSHGDSLLKATADIFKNACGNNTVVARIGEDEFAVLIPNATNEEIHNKFSEIRHLLLLYSIKNIALPLSLSLGSAITDGCFPDASLLLQNAEDKMHQEKLYRLQSVRSPIMRSIMGSIQSRYFMIEGPSIRMQNLVEGLAIALNLPEHRLVELRLLARFNDIGTLEIPDEILFKQGPLSEEERKIMQQHCEIGHRIARNIPELALIAEWILAHHEWWNGGGYPLHLKEQEIPLECRILAIADAYDAMTNSRPYRKAIGHREAIAELRKYAGVQFDPALVDLFISMFEKDVL